MARKGSGAAHQWLLDHAAHKSDECLFWPFSQGDGYGQFSHLGKTYRAHRYMCKLAHGEPPTPRHQAAHSCGRGDEGCFNQKHLSWKTNGENQRDRRRHGTKNTGGWLAGAKISPEQDVRIKELAKTKTQMEIAKLFGVSRSTIQYRLYGGSYKPRRERLIVSV